MKTARRTGRAARGGRPQQALRQREAREAERVRSFKPYALLEHGVV